MYHSTSQKGLQRLGLMSSSDNRLLAPQLLVNVEAHEVLPRDHAHHPAGTQGDVDKEGLSY
jgi:hypothetical protein